MRKNIRVRTKVGVDNSVTVNLEQDFDMLEILSLNIHQTDVYKRDCSDFGVIVGRVLANGGFGVPNAKVAVFLPIDTEDEENIVINELYPYKSAGSRNEAGYVYNLLPQDPSYNGHTPTGSFPRLNDVLLNQEVSYVYKKYYKFTAKTNDAGDFMIYGVPLGSQRLVMNVDLSDMGCFSMVPEDFKIQGFAESKFNGARFKSSPDLGDLPQIVQTQKQVEVRPFWGDDNAGCGASITRCDFDLRDLGVEIKPTAVFMGSLASESGKDSMNKNCRPRWHQGDLCYVNPQAGTIESVRFTPFFKEEEDPNNPGSGDQIIPVLERFDIDGGQTINEDGSFLINVPMNIDFMITNEFGEQVISKDPTKGVPTKGKYRFRVKPLNTTSNARLRRRAGFLVPNIREYNQNGGSGTIGNSPHEQYNGDEKLASYAFSINYWDYPEPARDAGLLLTCSDYFYEFSFGKVYTLSQFHNFWKHRHRKSFTGIKEIVPREEQSCEGERVPFPINTAIRNVNFNIIITQIITSLTSVFWQFIYLIMLLLCLIVPIIMIIINVILIIVNVVFAIINAIAWLFGASSPVVDPIPLLPLDCDSLFPCVKLRVTKFPECETCSCSDAAIGCINTGCAGEGDDNPNNDTDGDDYLQCSSPDDIVGTTTYAMDGCYLVNFQSIIGALASGTLSQNFETPKRWRRIEVTFRAMCDGLLNYTYKNNWVGGFLYAFQFKAKLKPDESQPLGYRAKFCAETIHFDPKMQEFYYRSCPSDMNGNFIGDTDTALISNNTTGGFLGLFELNGENRRNIHYPTTIMDLGPVQEYIGEICSMEGYKDGCSVSDNIGVTTHTNPGDLIFDGVAQRIVQLGNYGSGGWNIGHIFNSPSGHKEVGGYLSSIFSQFNEVGVVEYDQITSDDEDALSGGGAVIGDPLPPALGLGLAYAPAGYWTNPGGQYPPFGPCWNPQTISNAINTPPPSVGIWPDYSMSAPNSEIMTIAPRILNSVDVPFPTNMVSPGTEIRECLVYWNNESSQTVPIYLWETNTISPGGGPAFQGTDAKWRTNSIAAINLQDSATWQYQTTPIYADPDNEVILGTGYHYYFGTIPSATAMDIFVKKYVPLPQDPEEVDELFVI